MILALFNAFFVLLRTILIDFIKSWDAIISGKLQFLPYLTRIWCQLLIFQVSHIINKNTGMRHQSQCLSDCIALFLPTSCRLYCLSFRYRVRSLMRNSSATFERWPSCWYSKDSICVASTSLNDWLVLGDVTFRSRGLLRPLGSGFLYAWVKLFNCSKSGVIRPAVEMASAFSSIFCSSRMLPG